MIGIFDSGFGGLGILEKIKKELPRYDYLYFGDNKRAPYGDKTQEEIFEYTKHAIDFLFSKGCRVIIIACNTASTRALRKLQRGYLKDNYPNRRVLGIIIPTIEELVSDINKNKKTRVGLLATKSTIDSGVYKRELVERCKSEVNLINQASPLLVPIIEKIKFNNKEVDEILKSYLNIFKNKIDYLIIGCTHYHYVVNNIKKIINNDIKIIDPTNIITLKLKKYLKNHPEILLSRRSAASCHSRVTGRATGVKTLKKQKSCIYYTTGEIDIFRNFCNGLGVRNIKIEKVD